MNVKVTNRKALKTAPMFARTYLTIVVLIGVVALFGCSSKSDSSQDKDTTPAATTNAETSVETSSESGSGATAETPENRDVAKAMPEMGLVVQNYGMAKFSELKRLNDLGFALFSIFADGKVSSGISGSLTNYKIDWGSAKVSDFGATEISLLTPPIENLNTGQHVLPQQVKILQAVEKKITLNSPESFSAIVTIETLVSDSSRTICALGFSSR